jgi:hypothetical protein
MEGELEMLRGVYIVTCTFDRIVARQSLQLYSDVRTAA